MNDSDSSIGDKYGEIFEFNTAIVSFSRQKIVEVQAMAELHRQVAGRYDEIAGDLAELANESARLIAEGIAVEMGLRDEEDEDDE